MLSRNQATNYCDFNPYFVYGALMFNLVILRAATVYLVIGLLVIGNIESIEGSSSKQLAAKTDIIILEKAIENYKNDIGKYPNMINGLNALRTTPDDIDSWNGPYINKDIPLDPWGNIYVYVYPAKYGSKHFDIYSFGANKRDDAGGRDDIANWQEIDPNYYPSFAGGESVSLWSVLVFTILFFIVMIYRRRASERGENKGRP